MNNRDKQEHDPCKMDRVNPYLARMLDEPRQSVDQPRQTEPEDHANDGSHMGETFDVDDGCFHACRSLSSCSIFPANPAIEYTLFSKPVAGQKQCFQLVTL
jgi:hypothetical protein